MSVKAENGDNSEKTLKIIKKEDVIRWINELIKDYEVIAPVKEGGSIFFRIIKSADDVCMDFTNTDVSPKEFFLPRSEKIFGFTGEEILSAGKEERKRILFGVRPCDVNSLKVLDNVYLGRFNDPYYLKRRENTIIISVACSSPDSHCFCESVETGPYLCGADVILTDLGKKYFVESESGEMVNSDIFSDPVPGDSEQKEFKKKESERKITRKILNKSLLNKGGDFDDRVFCEASKICLACAACTYICPACTCFDVFDEEMFSARKGERVRCWDSCMFPSFTVLAGGENTRKKKADRFMNRFYHKFKYYPERYGRIACVGCGRCSRACPVKIDVVDVLNRACK